MEFIHVKHYKSEFIRKEEEDRLILQPAVVDFEGNSHIAPFLNNYIQINYIVQKIDPELLKQSKYLLLVESELVVFDRYYFRKRKEIISYKVYQNSLYCFDKQGFEDKITLINSYIDRGGDIFKIRFDRLYYLPPRIINPIQNLIRIASDLHFTFFETGRIAAKKDDWLWVEVEIRNLPKNDKYIIQLIHDSVNEIGHSYSVENYGVLLQLDDEGTENNKFPYERKICEKEFNLGEKILVEMINKYDMIEHSFGLLTSEAEIWS